MTFMDFVGLLTFIMFFVVIGWSVRAMARAMDMTVLQFIALVFFFGWLIG